MKLFRLRFIVLGLLLCIFHVWCRTCGTDFTDPESKAILADVVIEGKLSQNLQTSDSVDRFNFTVKVRKIIKGKNIFSRRKNPKYLTIGDFGPILDKENCVSNLTRDDTKYYFFLKATNQWNYLLLSAFPEKVTRRIGRKIRKVVTCKNCVKAPKIKKIKGRKQVKQGRNIQLRCQIAPVKPPPVIHWEKDGVVIRAKKGIKIKNGRRGSRLKISRIKSTDSGSYVCVVKNAVSSDRQSVNVRILPKTPVEINSTKQPGGSGTTSRFKSCPPEDLGYCLNNGECRIIVQLDIKVCKCPKAYVGERCEARDPSTLPDKDPRQTSLEKDRTLTIIGIVIGLLLFICICIASYFLAKRRRDRFYRRQEEKRRQSEATNNIPIPPPSYHKLPSIDAELGNSFSKPRPFERCYKNSETQTDDYIMPNPHTNINLYHNPMENSNLLRNPPSDRNSRTRLSGISAGKRNSDRRTSADSGGGHTGQPNMQPRYSGPKDDGKKISKPASSGKEETGPFVQPRRSSGQECKNHRNSIPPKIRRVSDMDINSEDENVGSLTPLHISEDDIPGQNDKHINDMLPTVNDTSSSYSSEGSTTSSVENLRHLNNVRDGGISWNERGSPEPVYKDSYNKGYNDHFHFLNDNMYPKSSKYSDKDRKKRHVSDQDSKSIPV